MDRLTAEAKRIRANSLAETRLTASMFMSEAAEHAASSAAFKVKTLK